MLQLIKNKSLKGEKNYVTSDSLFFVKMVEISLIDKKIDVLAIHSENRGQPKQKLFLENPDEYIRKYKPQVVIVSPVIPSGISIEVDYFYNSFNAYFNVVTPVVFSQMIHRLRVQKDFYIAFAGTYKKYREEDSSKILKECIKEDIKRFPECYQEEINENQTLITYDEKFHSHEKLFAETQAFDNYQHNNRELFFINKARDEGIEVNFIDINQDEKRNIRIKFKETKKIISENETNNILKVKDFQEYESNNNQRDAKSIEEFYKIKRVEIAKSLGRPADKINRNDIDFYNNNGVENIENIHDMKLGEKIAWNEDYKDKCNGVSIVNAKWRVTKVELSKLLFESLGISKKTYFGKFTAKDAQKTREAIIADDSMTRYCKLKLHLLPVSQFSDIAFVNKLLKKLFGIKIDSIRKQKDRKRVRIYKTNKIVSKTLQKYCKMRKILS